MVDPGKVYGPVGVRFRKQNVKNSDFDQKTVIDLLAEIPKAQGGKKEEWANRPLTGPTGSVPGHVAQAIWDFQEFWKARGVFKNIDGVVDPDKNTISQMNVLARGVTPPPSPVDGFGAKLKQNPMITLDGTSAPERPTPLHPSAWITKTQGVFDTLCLNTLGRQIVQSLHKPVIVKPYLDTDENAESVGDTIKFTADNFARSAGKPGAREDEVLFHEMVHVWERQSREYLDVPGQPFLFNTADFMTVNATNVYSSSLGRGLRKDHKFYEPMPSPFDADPGEHVRVFRENYKKAVRRTPPLFAILRFNPATWNPFRIVTP